jgi:hypothetical protein
MGRRRRDIWTKNVEELLSRQGRGTPKEVGRNADGGAPVVVLRRELEVTRSPRGRPRKRPPGAHRGWGYALVTPAGWPMRCRRVGCQRELRKNATTVACSPECAAALVRDLREIVDILCGGRAPTSLSAHLRGRDDSGHPGRRL